MHNLCKKIITDRQSEMACDYPFNRKTFCVKNVKTIVKVEYSLKYHIKDHSIKCNFKFVTDDDLTNYWTRMHLDLLTANAFDKCEEQKDIPSLFYY